MPSVFFKIIKNGKEQLIEIVDADARKEIGSLKDELATLESKIPTGGGSGTGGSITVDSALSSTSTNPVQNKAIKSALDLKASKDTVDALVDAIGLVQDGETETDKEAITIVESLDDMVNTSKLYAYNGYVYEYKKTGESSEPVPLFTDVLQTSKDSSGALFNGKGWKEGVKLDTGNGNEATLSAGMVTGFIPAKKGDVIYISPNIMIRNNASGTSYGQFKSEAICYYSDSTFLKGRSTNQLVKNGNMTMSPNQTYGLVYVEPVVEASDTTTNMFVYKIETSQVDKDFNNIRLSLGGTQSLWDECGGFPIVTINEPIEYDYSIVEKYEWVSIKPYNPNDYVVSKKNEIEKLKTMVSQLKGNNSFFSKKLYHHIGAEATHPYIPSESLIDIAYAKALGFDLIEANVQLCNDGVYLVKHGNNGALGAGIKADDGQDYSSTKFSALSSTWIRQHITYNTVESKNQTFIPTLDEFCAECARNNIKVKVSKPEAIPVVRKYMIDDKIWSTGTSRPDGFNGCIEYVWRGESVDSCINACKEIGTPLNIVISASIALDTLSDATIRELCEKAHNNGFTVGIVYPKPHHLMRCFSLGVDIAGSTNSDVNPIMVGNKHNICFLDDSLLTLTGATYDSIDDTISMSSGNKITISDTGFKRGIVSLSIRYNGNLTICGATNNASHSLVNFASNGSEYVIYNVVIPQYTSKRTKWLEITANASTTVYEIDVKCSYF